MTSPPCHQVATQAPSSPPWPPMVDALSRKERVKPRRVRAMAMTIQYGVRGMKLAAQSEAFKQENVLAERLHGFHCKEVKWTSPMHQDVVESVRDAIGFEYCLASSSGWTKDWESSLTRLELVQKTTDKVVLIKEKLKAARGRQKSYADNGRKPLEFEVGDCVLLKVSPWKGVIRFGNKGKLAQSWANEFHQDKASSVRVSLANFTLQSSIQLLQENIDSVRSNQQMRLTAPSVPLKLKEGGEKKRGGRRGEEEARGGGKEGRGVGKRGGRLVGGGEQERGGEDSGGGGGGGEGGKRGEEEKEAEKREGDRRGEGRGGFGKSFLLYPVFLLVLSLFAMVAALLHPELSNTNSSTSFLDGGPESMGGAADASDSLGFSGTSSLSSGRVDLTGDEDPTDEYGDDGIGDPTGGLMSLGANLDILDDHLQSRNPDASKN
ncbi:hypothetical protein Tco_1554236 [Tanacetum coccineum]